MSRLTLSRLIPIFAAAVVGAIVAVVLTNGNASNHPTTTTIIQQPSSASTIPTSLTTAKGMTINQIYRADSPGVVDIDVTEQSQGGGGGFGFFGGSGAPQQQQEAEGAGVVYDKSGDILTDQHVVANATSVTVNFQDGLKAKATVVGQDPSTDVAVIHVKVPASELHPITFADSSQAQVGDPVVAIGSPFSQPETVTAGIVSQTGRTITAPNNYAIAGAIQTDAAINPGNSGGPLLDADAQVLGLNDQIQTNSGSSSGVGFATPSNEDVRIANAIIAGHPVKHAYVGVELNDQSSGGAAISSVSSGSPAANAGLQAGDVITAVNGQAVTSTEQFIALVDNYSPGNHVTLTIKRGSSTRNISLTLATRPQSPSGG